MLDRGGTLPRPDREKSASMLKHQMIAIAAAVQAEHENHRASQERRGAHRAPPGKARAAEEADLLQRLIAERPVAQDADEGTLIQALTRF